MRPETIILLCLLSLSVISNYACLVLTGRAVETAQKCLDEMRTAKRILEQKRDELFVIPKTQNAPKTNGCCETCLHGFMGDRPEVFCPTCENHSNYEG